MDKNRLWLIGTLVTLLLLCFSCKKQSEASSDTYASTLKELTEFIEKPDSLLTPEQQTKKKTLFSLILESVTVKDGQLSSSAEEEDFTDKGLSKYYHDILETSLKEANQWLKEEKITNLDSLLQTSKNFLFKLQ
ncbi:MAG: hypothetical protein QM305_06465 [Bacteroidota bacterium]|nr:hypothetical protein [Bacteroidota bacterium]